MFHHSKDADWLFDSISDAVEDYLKFMPENKFLDFYLNHKVVRIYKYDPLPLNKLKKEHLLEFVLEKMDEDYLPDCCEDTYMTPEMEKLAEEFLIQLEAIYPRRSFTLNPDNKFIDVDAYEWVNKNKLKWV